MKKFPSPKKGFLTILLALTAAGLLFFFLFFSGSATPVYAADPVLPSFGRGPVEVRLYTDYFCGPCSAEEAELISLVSELVEKNLIRVLFIDTPVHRETVLFAGYFLATLNAKNDFTQAVGARKALFEAAEKKITEKEALEAFLKTKEVVFRPYDTAPVFKIFGNYLKEDQIRSTPSCVILGPQGKQTLTGKEEIVTALRGLRK